MNWIVFGMDADTFVNDHFFFIFSRFTSVRRGDSLEKQYAHNKQTDMSHPLSRALFTTHMFSLLVAGFFLGLEFGSAIAQAVILGELLEGMADESVAEARLFELAGWLSAITVARTLFTHVGHLYMHTTGMELRAAAIAAVYRKVVRVRAETLMANDIKTGQIITIMTAGEEDLG